MFDRLLGSSLNLTILALTAATGGGALLAGYWGLLALLDGRVVGGGWAVVGSAVGVVAALKLARHKNELVDR